MNEWIEAISKYGSTGNNASRTFAANLGSISFSFQHPSCWSPVLMQCKLSPPYPDSTGRYGCYYGWYTVRRVGDRLSIPLIIIDLMDIKVNNDLGHLWVIPTSHWADPSAQASPRTCWTSCIHIRHLPTMTRIQLLLNLK